MTATAADWFESEFEFRQICGDAQSQARSEWDQDFAAQRMISANQYGLNAFLSYDQLKQLCRIADWEVPARKKT